MICDSLRYCPKIRLLLLLLISSNTFFFCTALVNNNNNNNKYGTGTTTTASTIRRTGAATSFVNRNIISNQHHNCVLLQGSSASNTEEIDIAAALKRTKEQLSKLSKRKRKVTQKKDPLVFPNNEIEESYREYILLPGNSLKVELDSRNLPDKGRKPAMARRLSNHDWLQENADSDKSLANALYANINFVGNAVDADKEFNNAAVTDNLINEGLSLLKSKENESTTKKEQENMDDAVVVVEKVEETAKVAKKKKKKERSGTAIRTFCGLSLSEKASEAISKANYVEPTSIQKSAIPRLSKGESLILHAETGSGKTLTYLLPITEHLWNEYERENDIFSDDEEKVNDQFSLVLLPTRELAAQVAGIATVLSPPGSVRFISHPTNLLKEDNTIELGLEGDSDDGRRIRGPPKLLIGSAKIISCSLFGDKRLPATPTSKPKAQYFLKNIKTLVLDEVDKILNVEKTKGEKVKTNKRHEKPAAIISAAVARYTLGKAQIVSASATVGRPLKRELSRVLGLRPSDCPPAVVGSQLIENVDDEGRPTNQVNRAVTIPSTVQHYVIKTQSGAGAFNNKNYDTSVSDGKLLTTTYKVIQAISSTTNAPRILLVLTRGFGIGTPNVIGALKHFNCQPEPQSLLDALEITSASNAFVNANDIDDDGDSNFNIGTKIGTSARIQNHRKVSGAAGIGEEVDDDEDDDIASAEKGYLFVTGEDTIRGLHFDSLDVVLVIGKPQGPDEYTHIAGRTGRAGKTGRVINIVHDTGATIKQQHKSWENMLNINFIDIPNNTEDIKDIISS